MNTVSLFLLYLNNLISISIPKHVYESKLSNGYEPKLNDANERNGRWNGNGRNGNDGHGNDDESSILLLFR